MSVILSHPTGNANVRAVLTALENSQNLDSFWTSVAIPSQISNWNLLGRSLRRELGRRTFNETPYYNIRTNPTRELVRLARPLFSHKVFTRHETGWASVHQIYQTMDKSVSKYITQASEEKFGAVYAYEDVAELTFKSAKKKQAKCIYDLPIAYWRSLHELMKEEAELHPEWLATMPALLDSEEKLNRKDQEISLADHIIVPSTFVKNSIEANYGDNMPITVIPFGAPSPSLFPPSQRLPEDPIKIMFVGHIGQRKGIAYLIAALKLLEVPWSLTLAGSVPKNAPRILFDLLSDERCNWLGHLPHATLLEEMSKAHVFVFPSIAEGLAMVMYEAMSAGLPLIATPNSGAPDIIKNGQEGFIVPIRDPFAICEKIHHFYYNEAERQTMSANALATAARSGWDDYSSKIGNFISEVLVK